MNNSKPIYDYSNKELLNKFNNDFITNYNKNDYLEEEWEKIEDIYNEAQEAIIVSQIPLSTYRELCFKLQSIKKNEKKYISSVVIKRKLGKIFSSVSTVISKFFIKTSFIFIILLFTIFSNLLAFFLELLLGTFIYSILPSFVDSFHVRTILSAIIFIGVSFIYMKNTFDNNLASDKFKIIFKFVILVPIYSLIFLIFKNIDEIYILENFLPLFYPHLWISLLTKEYVISPAISLALNCIISSLMLFIYARGEEN